MKRIASVILLILVLVNIFSVTAFASSGDDSSDSGYSMTLNGVEQKLTYATSVTTTETAPSGKHFYNSALLPDVSNVTGGEFYIIAKDSWAYYLRIFNTSSIPDIYVSSSDGAICVNSSVRLVNRSMGLTASSWGSQSVYTLSVGVSSWKVPNIVYSSFPVKDETGKVISPTGTISDVATVVTKTEHTLSVPRNDYADLASVDRQFTLTGTPLVGEFTGDLKYSLTTSSPYIDVELPISSWVDEAPADEDYWSVSINGDLSFDLGIGLQGISAAGQSHYILSDLVPSSWQLICNGSLMDDFTCSGSFNSVGLTESGYHVNLSMDTGQFNLASVSTGEYGVKPRTLGFRIYLKSLKSGAATTISGYDFVSVTPYAYLNFTSADGSSGLPVLTFHENYASGDMSGVVDSSGYGSSVAGLGFNFGYYSSSIAASGKCF